MYIYVSIGRIKHFTRCLICRKSIKDIFQVSSQRHCWTEGCWPMNSKLNVGQTVATFPYEEMKTHYRRVTPVPRCSPSSVHSHSIWQPGALEPPLGPLREVLFQDRLELANVVHNGGNFWSFSWNWPHSCFLRGSFLSSVFCSDFTFVWVCRDKMQG